MTQSDKDTVESNVPSAMVPWYRRARVQSGLAAVGMALFLLVVLLLSFFHYRNRAAPAHEQRGPSDSTNESARQPSPKP